MNKNKKNLILLEIILIISCAIFIYPIFLVIINSLKSYKGVMTNVIALPDSLHFENYAYVWENINYPRLFINNIIVTATAIIGIVLFCSIAGFILSRTRTRLSWLLYIFCIAPMLIPFQTIMITLINMYHGFVKSIPKEIDESAIIDGASTSRMFFSIIFPLLKPITTTIVVIDVMWIWNDFLLPLIFLDGAKETKTLTLAAYTFIGQYITDWQYAMTAIVLAVIPSVLFFISMQKHIVKGITAGAVKG